MNGLMHGVGTLTSQNSEVYHGQFEFGYKHGLGKNKNNETLIGSWFQNQLHGIILKDGNSQQLFIRG